MNTQCYACGCTPDPGEWSEEHVIPNALGGRWTSSRLLCRACNSDFGSKIDATLCRELGAPMNLLGLSRERGEVPNQVVQLEDGEYLRDAQGNLRLRRPVIREDRSEHEVTINIQGGSTRDVRKALEGIARKYPGKIDIDQWMSGFTGERRFYMAPTHFEVPSAGSDEAFRAVTKIAASAYVAAGGAREQILSALDYIGGRNAIEHARWFYSADVMTERGADDITHVVALRGEPGTPLWGYVEMFRAYRFAVRLAERYAGPALRADYVYDLVAGATIAGRSIQLDFADLDVKYGGIDVDAMVEHWTVLIRVAQRRSREASVRAAVRQAFDRAFAQNPEATAADLMPHLWSALEPIVLAMLRRPDGTADNGGES